MQRSKSDLITSDAKYAPEGVYCPKCSWEPALVLRDESLRCVNCEHSWRAPAIPFNERENKDA